ncbi:MAG TPA: type II toxin-antitoxin system VapB family antitoxin, partial [Thermomicrobiales bacterium]|nr:type II toxin-antitoxin system VapB family antitoxin [Thermomicrobiales bacterium]
EVFTNEEGQAVRIPDHLRFETDTVYIQKIGSALVLTPTADLWDAVFEARMLVSADFMATRDQQPWQERDWPA